MKLRIALAAMGLLVLMGCSDAHTIEDGSDGGDTGGAGGTQEGSSGASGDDSTGGQGGDDGQGGAGGTPSQSGEGPPPQTQVSEITEADVVRAICEANREPIEAVVGKEGYCIRKALEEQSVAECQEANERCLARVPDLGNPCSEGGAPDEQAFGGLIGTPDPSVLANCAITLGDLEACLIEIADAIALFTCEAVEIEPELPLCLAKLERTCPELISGDPDKRIDQSLIVDGRNCGALTDSNECNACVVPQCCDEVEACRAQEDCSCVADCATYTDAPDEIACLESCGLDDYPPGWEAAIGCIEFRCDDICT